jgi:hypothetical protein
VGNQPSEPIGLLASGECSANSYHDWRRHVPARGPFCPRAGNVRRAKSPGALQRARQYGPRSWPDDAIGSA